MQQQSASCRFQRGLVASSLFLAGVFAAPAPVPVAQHTYYSDPAAVMTAIVSQVGPPGASGTLYGSPSLIGYNPANPSTTDSTVIPASDFELAPGQSEDGDLGLYLDFDNVDNFQPIRGSTDAPTDPGPRGYEYERMNSDLYAPPSTDMGSVPNAKWPMGLSHNRHGSPASAGWARQQNNENLPVAAAMAGVDFRLSPNAYRELHWHTANEWALMIKGSVRIATVNDAGQSFIDDLNAGDVWFFPSGVPHSIQAKENGCEFLLIFDDGAFDESATSLVSELFLRMPKEVLAKDLRTDISAFDNIPDNQLYIFPGTPAPANIDEQRTVGPAGENGKNMSYSYHWSQQTPYSTPGGTVKIIDSASFPIASNFAGALVTIEPGAMREIHWHPTSDEWNFFLQGRGRVTVFMAPTSSGTFDFQAGDVGYIPATQAHYIENTSNETIIFLEMLQAPRFTDISVAQWLALTPRQVVEDHLHLPNSTLAKLPKVKPYLVPGVGGFNTTRTNFTAEAE